MSELLRGRQIIDHSLTERTIRLNVSDAVARRYLRLTGVGGVEVKSAKGIGVGNSYEDGGNTRTVFPGSQLVEITGTDAQIAGVIDAVLKTKPPVLPKPPIQK